MATFLTLITMLDQDPIFSELASGKKLWGDILSDSTPSIKKTITITTTTEILDDTWAPVTKKTHHKKENTIKTIIARNLPRDVSTETLRSTFAKFGHIKDIYIPKNMDKTSPYYGTTKGFALIKFVSPQDSLSAYNSLYNNLTISNKIVTVEFAKEDR